MRSIRPVIVSLGLATAMAAPAAADEYTYERDTSGLVYGGLGVSLGGGVSTFSNKSQRDFTGTAGTWDARVAWGTRFPIGFEAAYIGSAQSIDRLGLEKDAVLLSNGAEGVVRVNLLPTLITPYVHVGAAWRRYTIENSNRNLSDVVDQDDVFEVPMGVGADYRYHRFLIDGRATYRLSFDDELLRSKGPTGTNDNQDLHTIGARIAIGMEF